MRHGPGAAAVSVAAVGAVVAVAAVTAGVMTASLVLGGLPAAQAATAGTTTFTFSGSLQGTLKQANSACNEVGGYGGQFEFDGNRLKGSSADTWTVNVNALNGRKNGGTYKEFGGLTGNGVSIVLDGSNGKTAYYWASKSGTLTTGKTGGKLSVDLVPDRSLVGKPGKGDVHLTGSWGCSADPQ